MAKIIRSSIECGWKVGTLCLHNYDQHSKHAGSPFLSCDPKGEENFPSHCPLEDGMSLERNSEKASLSFLMRHNHGNPRRTRQQCVYFGSGTISKNNCTNGYFRIVGSMVYPKCKGVKCGHFAKAVKWK